MKLPHPLVLLLGFVVLAAALGYVLPAGEFARHKDAATGREVVVPGSYRRVAPTPVGPLQVLVDYPEGNAGCRRGDISDIPGRWRVHRRGPHRGLAARRGLAAGPRPRPRSADYSAG